MKNLGEFLTKENVEAALEFVIKEEPEMNSATKYSLVYKSREFPPKEVARIAAKIGGIPESQFLNYRLSGGDNTNKYFKRLGFKIIKFSDKETQKMAEEDKSKRIARLTWNSKGWVGPSGMEGKSIAKDSHEARFGYGHEEWLFDISKTIDGYHYGFIEPIRIQSDAYRNKTFDVLFYTVDGTTNKRYWAGRIKELEAIDRDTAESIKQEYDRLGWLSEMEIDLISYQQKGKQPEKYGWSNYNGLDFFNIRYHPEALEAEGLYVPISKEHPITNVNRYKSFTIREGEYLRNIPTSKPSGTFVFTGTNKPLDPTYDGELITKTFDREPLPVEITYLHRRISNGLTRKLREQFGDYNVEPEYAAGFLSREIDIVANTPEGLIFYEIKTYNSLMQSIRVAIGQLMEYALWESESRAAKWILITQPHANHESAETYFQHLRNTYNLPLYFSTYDWKKNVLSEPL